MDSNAVCLKIKYLRDGERNRPTVHAGPRQKVSSDEPAEVGPQIECGGPPWSPRKVHMEGAIRLLQAGGGKGLDSLSKRTRG